MPTFRTLHLLLALGLVCAIATPAAAERAALFVGGTARDLDRPALVAIARAEAEAAGWVVTEPPLGDTALTDLMVCVSSGLGRDCIPGHLDDHDVDRGIVISVALEGKKRKRAWVVNGWVFKRSGDLLITDRRYCEGCKMDRLGDTVRDLASTLIREARARSKPTVIVAKSRPTGAQVFIDDQRVGVTAVEIPVEVGIRVVRFELEGHEPQVREVVVGDGESLNVEVSLEQVAAPAGEEALTRKDPPGASRPSRIVPLTVLGVGVAALVAGGVVLAMDEDPVQGGTQVPRYTDTALPAVGLLAAGAAVTSLGVYLWLRTRSHRSADAPAPAKTPAVGVARGGVWLGLTGRF